MDNYPRMLYRPGDGPSEILGEPVDTKIVNSSSEEQRALRDGWLNDAELACEKSKSRRALKARLSWFKSHWQFWISAAIATAGVVVAYLALE